jgi:iron complex outermembrane receptor protein
VPNVSNSGLNVNLLDPATGAPLPINPAFGSPIPNGIPDRAADFDPVPAQGHLELDPSDDMTVYASYGVGFRSGGFNAIGTEDLLNFWFNAGFGGPGEVVDAQLHRDRRLRQGGLHGLRDRRQVRVAGPAPAPECRRVPHDVEDNQFFEFYAGPFGILRTVTTIDELYIQGARGRLHLRGHGLPDSLWRHRPDGFGDREATDHRPLSEGNDVPQAPETTGNLGAELSFPLTGTLELVSRLDWQYTGEMWFHTLQGEQTPTIWNAFFGPGFNQDFSKSARDAFSLVDLRVGCRERTNWSVTAWGRNLGDEQYLQEIIPTPEFGGSFVHPVGAAQLRHRCAVRLLIQAWREHEAAPAGAVFPSRRASRQRAPMAQAVV